jgi:hypothetical protein
VRPTRRPRESFFPGGRPAAAHLEEALDATRRLLLGRRNRDEYPEPEPGKAVRYDFGPVIFGLERLPIEVAQHPRLLRLEGTQ